MTNVPRPRRSHGFTLIELAIVLVVLGLLIAGVTAGQELITAARTRAQVAQLGQLQAAVVTFQEKYGCTPGDCHNAVEHGLGTAGGVGDNGNGDGRITSMIGLTTATSKQEALNVWFHLSRAGMLAANLRGADGLATNVFTGYFPPAAVRPTAFVSAATLSADWPFGNALVVHGSNPTNPWSPYGGGLSIREAHEIDIKLDDGSPATGMVVSMFDSRVVEGGNFSGCSKPNPSGGWRYDADGEWVSYSNQIRSTPPNPHQINCTLAVKATW